MVLEKTPGLMPWWFVLPKFQTTRWDGVGWGLLLICLPLMGWVRRRWEGGMVTTLQGSESPRGTQGFRKRPPEMDPGINAHL